MPHDEGCLVTTMAIIRTLARGDPTFDLDVSRLGIPGPDSPEKRALEQDLATLINRFRYLEAKAIPVSVQPSMIAAIANDDGTLSSGNLSEKGEVKGLELAFAPLDQTLKGHKGPALDSPREFQSKTITDSVQMVDETSDRVESLQQELKKSHQTNRALSEALREIGAIVTAVAKGDLSKKVTVNAMEIVPEITTLKNTINSMTDQLQTFASEVSRVAREVGTEGQLGGQARVDGVQGTWKELTENVNVMASNLTNQVREIADVTTAIANGDLSRKVLVHAKGEILELQRTINTMVNQLRGFTVELSRVSREVAVEGILGGQAEIGELKGTWKELTDNINAMAANLTDQVRNIATVTTAVAQGDFSRKVNANCKGEILELKETINKMVDDLQEFATEVTKVTREVGTEGKLGGQAKVEGIQGTWRVLTQDVNKMATNLTTQFRSIASVTTAIAEGNLSRKIEVEARGEILQLKDTINKMVEHLRDFAIEVSTVTREIGIDGILGGRAKVQDAEGIWKDLVGKLNVMADNLTILIRSIAEVTAAIAKGDKSRKITMNGRGEIFALQSTINRVVERMEVRPIVRINRG